MTATDEILALAASADVLPADAAPASTEAASEAVVVTEADLAAFREAAARGAGSGVVRALLAIRPAASSDDPAWDAWLTAAAAAAAVSRPAATRGSTPAATRGSTETEPVHAAWLAVFAAGTALSCPAERVPARVTAAAAIATGMSAAAITETGLTDWGGWSSGSVAGVIGAGVTAGLLLGLTQPQLRAALGICATQAAGLAAAEGTPAFALQVGKAAFNGVESALLARAGLTAADEPLDGRRGLFALFSPDHPSS